MATKKSKSSVPKGRSATAKAKASCSVLMLASLSACTHTPQIDLIAGARRVNGQSGLGTCAVISQRLKERHRVYYLHCSDLSKGRPFNDRFDISDDVIGYGLSFGGKPRD